MSFSSQPGLSNYKDIASNIQVNQNYVNIDNSHDPSIFGSKDTSSQFGCIGVASNVDAVAASKLMMTGGKKSSNNFNKIKISSKYRMTRGKMNKIKGKLSKAKRNLISLLTRKQRKTTNHKKNTTHNKTKFRKGKKNTKMTRRHKQLGGDGYHQFMSNVAYTPSYSTGGILSPSDSMMANPTPFTRTNNCPIP